MRGATESGAARAAGDSPARDRAVHGQQPETDAVPRADGPTLEFRPATGAMLPLIETYYLYRWDAERITGIERVDAGQIRFLLRGSGTLTFADGHSERSCPVMVNASCTAAGQYRVDGPIHCFGISLRPTGWRSLIGVPADSLADRVADGAAIFGPEVLALRERLCGMATLDEMVAAVEPMLAAHRRPIPEAHLLFSRTVREWLATPALDIEALYAALPMSRRQVMRLCNGYFGGPPTHLRRKYRALNAAIRLRRGEAPADVAGACWEQSHMINEVKHFTGHTPTSLRDAIDPVLAVTLDGESFHTLPEVFPEQVDPDGG